MFGGSGRESSCHLGAYVGCKMGPRWVQKGLESDFFAQLGVLMGILAPRWQDKASQDGSGVEEAGGSRRDLEEVESAGGGGVVQQGGGGSKDPRVGL